MKEFEIILVLVSVLFLFFVFIYAIKKISSIEKQISSFEEEQDYLIAFLGEENMSSTKNGKTKTKITNYDFYKEKIVQSASLGSFCGTCLARDACERLPDNTADIVKMLFLLGAIKKIKEELND